MEGRALVRGIQCVFVDDMFEMAVLHPKLVSGFPDSVAFLYVDSEEEGRRQVRCLYSFLNADFSYPHLLLRPV